MSLLQDTRSGTAIRMIDINHLVPHPDNPRKSLGDLTELADSIRANGILQNLTVVEYLISGVFTGKYRVVIGHRRLAAAKMAGLKELPCIVAQMTENQQRIMMLTENMQRTDLTLVEQAEAFQTMLDLGDSIASLADKTGLSESTVRRRVKLAALDQQLLTQAEARGGTMKDYLALEEITDPARKNKVLATIGTPDFSHTLKYALMEDKVERMQPAWRAALSAFAAELKEPDWRNHQGTGSWSYEADPEEFTPPGDADKTEYFFYLGQYSVNLYTARDQTASEKEAQAERKEAERRQRVAQLQELSQQATARREDFIRNLPAVTLWASASSRRVILGRLLENLISDDDWKNVNCETFARVMDIRLEGEWMVRDDIILPALDDKFERALLALAWASSQDTDGNYVHSYYGTWRENEDLDLDYGFLVQLGYEMSTLEIQLQNGTHPLFDGSFEEAGA